MGFMTRISTDDTRRPAVVEQLTRVLRSLEVLLGDVQATWAKALELTVPQWNILVTVADADNKVGMSVKSVAEALKVNPSFVVHQSRPLEARGFIQRIGSSTDKRIVYLTITPKALRQLGHLAESRSAVDASIKRELGETGTQRTILSLNDLEQCLLRCRLRVQLDE
jgi:DNA-binding MarR family transcriptional regulator